MDDDLAKIQDKIETKGHKYNLLYDDTQPTNLMYKTHPEKRQEVMANLNKVVKSNIKHYSKMNFVEEGDNPLVR